MRIAPSDVWEQIGAELAVLRDNAQARRRALMERSERSLTLHSELRRIEEAIAEQDTLNARLAEQLVQKKRALADQQNRLEVAKHALADAQRKLEKLRSDVDDVNAQKAKVGYASIQLYRHSSQNPATQRWVRLALLGFTIVGVLLALAFILARADGLSGVKR